MPTYGLTPEGFTAKRLADIQNDINTRLATISDPDTGELPFQNAQDDTLLQQVVGVFAEELSVAWQAITEAYFQFDPLHNTGQAQSSTVQLNAITRRWGSASQVQLKCKGTAGTYIPRGSLVSDITNTYIYSTDEALTLNTSGEGQVTATRNVTGEYNPEPGTINSIQSPVSIGRWDSVENIETINPGSAEETDEELRERQQVSTMLTSYRQVEAIYAALRAIEGVIYVRVLVNSTKSPQDERGIPYKEVCAIVEGGNDDDIADALFLRFPVGIVGHGSTQVGRVDIQGVNYVISFQRPESVPIYVDLHILVYDRAAFPDNGIGLIKQAIVDYAEYAGGEYKGFPPGENVVYTRLYTPINEVNGFSIVSLKIGKEESPTGETDIPIQFNEVARFYTQNITVTIDDPD